MADNFESVVNYTTKLSNFEGPLDLLLHLIKIAEIDIKDIFVSEVTNQFLEYVRNTKIAIDVLGEYLSIAATIIEIKSKAVIPNEEVQAEVDEEKRLFIERLQRHEEYKLYLESVPKLKEMETVDVFYKEPDDSVGEVKVVYNDFNLDGLIKAFTDLLAKADIKESKKKDEKEIPKEVFTVADKITFITEFIKSEKKIFFSDLFYTENVSKSELITTFQALLELIKHQIVSFSQEDTFGSIILEYNENGGDEIVQIDEYN